MYLNKKLKKTNKEQTKNDRNCNNWHCRESYTSRKEKYSFVKQFCTNIIKITDNKQGRNTFINGVIRQVM